MVRRLGRRQEEARVGKGNMIRHRQSVKSLGNDARGDCSPVDSLKSARTLTSLPSFGSSSLVPERFVQIFALPAGPNAESIFRMLREFSALLIASLPAQG